MTEGALKIEHVPFASTYHSQDAPLLKPFPPYSILQTKSGDAGILSHLANVVQLDRQGWDSDRRRLTPELAAFSTAGFQLHTG